MYQFIGKIYAWDVVNEVIDEVSGKLRDSIFSRTFNYSFIEEAFRTAHAADPNAKLYINEYNLEAVDTKSDALYALVKELKGKGVPVHGVGLQGHFRENEIPSTFQDNLKRFSDLGVDVAITELGIRYKLPGSADKIAKQAQDYSHAFSDASRPAAIR
jgi:endo-1,4-beta-xylanase